MRHDIRPEPSRNHFVLGMQGLAPYWFEVDGAVFVSDEGVVSARIEAEYELRFTQRLILQPRFEMNAALEDDPEVGVGAGIGETELGLRLRYEVRREFAPYLGLIWRGSFGETRDLVEAEGGSADDVSLVAGLRFWF